MKQMFIIACATTVLALAGPNHAQTADDYSLRTFDAEPLLADSRQLIHIKRTARNPAIYMGYIFDTFNYPLSHIERVLTDFGHFTAMFANIHRFERLSVLPDSADLRGTYYAEGRVGPCRIWGIADIDSIVRIDSTDVQYHVSQNENPELNAAAGDSLDGWLTIKAQGLELIAYIRRINAHQCRAGVAARAQPQVPIPSWLFRLGLRIVLPRIIRELDNTLEKEWRNNGSSP